MFAEAPEGQPYSRRNVPRDHNLIVPTHYEILGLDTTADEGQLRSAYRRLAREYHPDVNPASEAKERFQEVQRAYEVLSDPRLKQTYDSSLGVTRTSPPGADHGGLASKEELRRAKEQREAEELRQKAEAMMREHAQATRADPVETERLTGLLNAGKYAEAEQVAHQIIAREARQPVPYAVLGDIARVRGERSKAIQYYALAAQYEPRNTVYQKSYEDMLASEPVSPKGPVVFDEAEANQTPVALGGFVVALMAVYVAIAPERPLGLGFASQWTLGAVTMLFLAGIVTASTLCLAGVLGRCDLASRSAVIKVSPMVTIGLVSVVSFWLACAVYFFVGQTQQAFSRPLSVFLGSVAGVTAVLGLAGLAKGPDLAAQNLIWGANLVCLGAMAGWIVTSRLRHA